MNAKTVKLSVLSWNVRGLGDADKCRVVRDLIQSLKLDIVCLQETKLRTVDERRARAFLPPNLSLFRCVDASGSRGGILTAWDPRAVLLHSFIARKHTLSLAFTSTTSDAAFTVTNVYAPSDHRDSLAFLLDLEEIAAQISGNWVIAGDFNLTRGASDNSSGAVDTRLADAFNDSIHKLGLIDIPLLDKLFTWSNHRDCPSLARLDRFFFNAEMSTAFPNSTLVSAPKPL